ncbi:MAG: response regulator [Turicibacter sp.]|nr:response regulator [Turicibacter sp.]
MKTILFVEDDKLIHQKVKLAIELELMGEVRVLSAYSAKEARGFVSLMHIDIFIFDIKLPDGDGVELAREIRRMNETAPMIFTSSVNDLRTQVEINNSINILLYLQKPYEANELVLNLKSIIRRLGKPVKHYINLRIGAKTFKINLNNVVLVEKVKSDKKIDVYILDPLTQDVEIKTFPMQSLEKFQERLNDSRDLLRVNQSAFVNPKYVDYYDGSENEIHLNHVKRVVTIGRTFKGNLKILLKSGAS